MRPPYQSILKNHNHRESIVKSYRLQWKITDYMHLQVLVVDHSCISIQNCSDNCH